MHVTPSPVYPWLQLQAKLPGPLVQVALVSQLSATVAHSSISRGHKYQGFLNSSEHNYTHACYSIFSVSLVTGTGETARAIATGSISVTVISSS